MDVKGVGVRVDRGFVVLVILVEERWGVECEGKCCCGAGGEGEQLVYHDADFGGETQEGEGLCAIVGFFMSWS